jgi:hypothetical protein
MTTSTSAISSAITEAVLNEMTGAQLVQKYNELSQTQVKKFTDKKTAIARIMKVVGEQINTEIVLPAETVCTTVSHHSETTTTTQQVAELAITPETPSLLDDVVADVVTFEEVQPVVEAKKRGRKPAVDGVAVPKKAKKVRGISKEMRLVHLFTSNPGKEISLPFAKMVFEGVATIEESEAIKTSSFNCVLAYIRNSITGFGMRINKEGKNLVYVPQRNTINWTHRKAHIKGLLDIVQNAVDSGTYTPYELPTA